MQSDYKLLQGESADWSAADAHHWANVYRELVAFCRQVLADAEAGDGSLIRRRLGHLEERLAFWEAGGITKA